MGGWGIRVGVGDQSGSEWGCRQDFVRFIFGWILSLPLSRSEEEEEGECSGQVTFLLCPGPLPCIENKNYSLRAPGTKRNAFRLLRAMQLRRPLLLEGPPGVGKTSLVTALAQLSGNGAVRINLSEQTVRIRKV